MNNDVLHYAPFIGTLVSFLAAQAVKPFIAFFQTRKWDWRKLFTTGGMPSSHTAGCITLTTILALEYGLASCQFVIAGTFTSIVIRDALGLRREAGRQAEAINRIADSLSRNGHEAGLPGRMKTDLGHNGIQVFGGFLFGLVLGILFHIWLD